jgi:hypothetical protein
MDSTTDTNYPIDANDARNSSTRPSGAVAAGATPFAGGESPHFADEFETGPAGKRSVLSKVLGVFALIIFSVIAVVFTTIWVAVTLIGSAVGRLRSRPSRRTTSAR